MSAKKAAKYEGVNVDAGSGTANLVRVDEKIGEGNEGVVYKTQYPDPSAVKIFFKDNRDDKKEKISAMVKNKPKLKDDTGNWSLIWPQKVVEDPKTGDFLGYEMEYLDSDNFEMALKHAMQSLEWTQCSKNDRYKAAYNLATAVQAVHDAGHAIGDFNHKNILVDTDTKKVILIDTDGFHIKDGGDTNTGSKDDVDDELWDNPYGDSNGNNGENASNSSTQNNDSTSEDNEDIWENPYRSDGGATIYPGKTHFPRYSPPEKRTDEMGMDEVIDVDRFCLGVHIFQLLMNGTHPFSASGENAANGSPAKKIKDNPFPYGSSANKIKPRQGAPDYYQYPQSIRQAFEKCFKTGAKQFNYDRTKTETWITVLSKELGDDPSDQNRTNPNDNDDDDDLWENPY